MYSPALLQTSQWTTEALSTRIRFRLKTHLFLPVLAFHPHQDGGFLVKENRAFWKRSTKWIHLKTQFLHRSVDCENGGFWKRWRKFSHVTYIVPIDIYVYTGIVPVMCNSLSHYCYRCVTLYTHHSPAKMKENVFVITVCSKTWGELHFRSDIQSWVRATWMSQWMVRYFPK